MPRSHRPRRHGRPVQHPQAEEADFAELMHGWKRTEMKRGAEYQVQPISAARAVKAYSCPGCGALIVAGTAHLVTWRVDGVLGEEHGLRERRHWHEPCWRIA